MNVTLKKPFRCSRDGVNIETLPAGTVVDGKLAESAMAQGLAKKPTAKSPLANKAEASPAGKPAGELPLKTSDAA